MDGPVQDDRPFKMETVLLDALKTALADPREHRLFRSGKLDGLFPSKLGLSLDAANHALRHELLTVVRTEARGPVSIEWVAVTARGIEFVYSHDAPRAVLGEMRGVLLAAKAGIPAIAVGMQREVEKLSAKFAGEMEACLKRLDSLAARVEEAIRRMDAAGPLLAEPLQALIPWSYDAVSYLDQRRQVGANGPCPLPELFEALGTSHPTLEIPGFHDGLRRLADNRAIKLLPAADTPQPEFALILGSQLLYLVER